MSTKTSGTKSTNGSGSAAGTPAAKPVKTRTSVGGHADDSNSGHDD